MPKGNYTRWVPQAPISNLYPYAYNFVLIDTIEKLNQVLSPNFNAIAFDTETSGLNNDEAFMVGYSFCYDGKNAYYVPVNHAPYIDENGVEHNESLGYEAVKIFYEALTKPRYIFTFNQRFDIRVFEKYGFHKEDGPYFRDMPYEERDRVRTGEFDMSRYFNKYIDVQALVFDSDTNVPYPNLKGSEEYYLGWRGASFKETLGDAENFYQLRPCECYTYAATDALGTYLLAQVMWSYYTEPATRTRYPKSKFPNIKNSGELDTLFLYPLMMMEDEYTQVDNYMMQKYSRHYDREIKRVQKELDDILHHPINAGSPKQKSEAFKELGIVTYEPTNNGELIPALNKRGEAKSDKGSMTYTIERLKLDEKDTKRIFMEDLMYMATLTKQKGTYADNFTKFGNESPYKNHLRFGYKTMVVPSGRLAAGGDKKNKYFADSNIQNITKPKIGMNYYVRYDELIQKLPQFTGMMDNAREECLYNQSTGEVRPVPETYQIDGKDYDTLGYEKCFRILDWVFKETVWHIDGLHEMKIEGFKQKLNIRSGFTPDDDKYWVSCDFSAQELRVPALLTREPLWSHTFENGGDLHEVMARKIWGDENYDKQKRKRAKRCNFGILYGMTPRNFAIDFEIPIEEAEKLVDDYKSSAPVLFNWVHLNEQKTIETGVTQTMFGRPRRLGWYLSKDRDRGMQNFGIRSCTNTVIQGTGADILKMSFLNIYDKFYSNLETRNINRKYIKFMNTVHDEINYNVSKQHLKSIVPMIISCMRLWLDDWDFPMQVGLDIGTRWGQTVAFDYDTKPYVEAPSTFTGQRYTKMSDEEAQRKDIHGLKKYIPDSNGNLMENPNYLHIIGPGGEDVTEKDYEVVVEEPKEEKIEEIKEVDENGELPFDNLFMS